MKKYLNSVEEVVKALKEGKKVCLYSKQNLMEYYMIDGIICSKDNINVSIWFRESDNYYTEEPEPLKFEVNALYKTSKNKKAFLYKIVKGADFKYYFSSEDGCFTTDENGVFYNFGLPTDNKIVWYWEEEK